MSKRIHKREASNVLFERSLFVGIARKTRYTDPNYAQLKITLDKMFLCTRTGAGWYSCAAGLILLTLAYIPPGTSDITNLPRLVFNENPTLNLVFSNQALERRAVSSTQARTRNKGFITFIP
ncbi:hypothetical protein RRG08_065531 [Elysia crispata]|uniref:Uncharacterized protein n=1 Tax=Elysia crispata TaxID=231223 RepID=A0AAE1B847_9GAST|nr:hypothetical protein RRG08_065531 [Elysia crispata]